MFFRILRSTTSLVGRWPSIPLARRAFTLVELLTVVSILGLLLSLLLPALAKARESAKALHCLANLKSLGASSLVYAAADAGAQCVPIHPLTGVVPGDSGAYDWGGKAGRGAQTSPGESYSSPWSTASGRGPGSRPLNLVLYKSGLAEYRDNPGIHQGNWISDQELDLPLFRCRSDRGYTGHHYVAWRESQLSSFDHYGNSYAANTMGGSIGGLPEHLYLSVSPFYRSTTLVPSPARTVYYVENAGRFAWHLTRGSSNDPSLCFRASGVFAPAEGELLVKGWHRKLFRFQTAFVDGHATTIEMRGFRIPPPELSFYPGVTGFSSYESLPTWDYWKCVIVRGRDWVLDTLPAAGVLTQIPFDFHTPFHAEIR